MCEVEVLGVEIAADDGRVILLLRELGAVRVLPIVVGAREGAAIAAAYAGLSPDRPMTHDLLLSTVRALGADIEGNSLPFTVTGAGRLKGGRVEMDASASSQFVSGMLLSAARFDEGVEVVHTAATPVPSGPHIEMTLEMLRESGVTVEQPTGSSWRVAPGPVAVVDRTVEPDLSNATPFLAAAAVTGGTVRVPHWPVATTQPGDAIRGILQAMGATVTLDTAGDGSGQRGGQAGYGTLVVVGPERLSDRKSVV